jgi:hypothetical protein
MTLAVGAMTLDCNDVATVAEFWSAALDVPIDPGASRYMASINREGAELPRFMFLKVPESKGAKNRLHLDLIVNGPVLRGDEVARLVDLGATHVADKDEWGHSWAVMIDPEGNEFCVSRGHDSLA